MPRILLTAFEPYADWTENSSWLTVIELTRWFDSRGQLVTRRYPVNLSGISERLTEDLSGDFTYAIHLGQAPGATAIKLESTGLNVLDSGQPILPDGPAAYRTKLPLDRWAKKLAGEGIPAMVSHHAGTYMCNATMFLSHHLTESQGLPTQSCFIHLPLAPQQAAKRIINGSPMASMSLPMMAGGLALLIAELLDLQSA
jgi:pyroglutamyl-peptidase